MRILLASTFVPLIDGGGRMIVRDLESMLTGAGHEVDILWIPSRSEWSTQPEQMLAIRLTDVWHAADRLVTIRPPAHLLRHPNKVMWFIHHIRGAYDLWGTAYGDIPDTRAGRRVRDAIVDADNQAFADARAIFTNSITVSDRLRRFNGVESEVLYPPLMNADSLRPGPYGDYVLLISRIATHKRQRLAIEAMRHVRSSARLIVAGAPDSEPNVRILEAALADGALRDRVELIARWISDEEKIELVAGARALLYMPHDEDSYGYPSLEAFHAAKPVITCSDSGGTLELIEDGLTGFIVAPEARAIAAAIDRLFDEPDLAEALGKNTASALAERGISRARVVARMTS